MTQAKPLRVGLIGARRLPWPAMGGPTQRPTCAPVAGLPGAGATHE